MESGGKDTKTVSCTDPSLFPNPTIFDRERMRTEAWHPQSNLSKNNSRTNNKRGTLRPRVPWQYQSNHQKDHIRLFIIILKKGGDSKLKVLVDLIASKIR